MAIESNGGRRRRRRPIPLRIRVVIAGLLGLLVAWLIPKGGGQPTVSPTATPTAANGITAVEERLTDVSPGVSFRVIDRVRIFLVRTGDTVVGFVGVATTSGARPLYWCIPGQFFEGDGPGPFYERDGTVYGFSADRNLDRVTVIVAAGRVTILPHEIVRGGPGPSQSTPPADYPLPACAAGERIG